MVTRKPQQIVGFDIAYDKNENRIQKIVDKAVKTKFYYSDANSSYQDVSYFGKRYYFRNKSHTFTVEGVNSDIRKYTATLQRKSKCFLRSFFKAVMSIFVIAYNSFDKSKFDFPYLRSVVGLSSFLSYL